MSCCIVGKSHCTRSGLSPSPAVVLLLVGHLLLGPLSDDDGPQLPLPPLPLPELPKQVPTSDNITAKKKLKVEVARLAFKSSDQFFFVFPFGIELNVYFYLSFKNNPPDCSDSINLTIRISE